MLPSSACLTARSKIAVESLVQVLGNSVGTLSVAISSREHSARPKLPTPHTGRLCVLANVIQHCMRVHSLTHTEFRRRRNPERLRPRRRWRLPSPHPVRPRHLRPRRLPPPLRFRPWRRDHLLLGP